MLHRIYTFKETALMTREDIRRLIDTKFNGRQINFLFSTFKNFFR